MDTRIPSKALRAKRRIVLRPVRLVSTNLAGFPYVTQQAVRKMRKQGTGLPVNITTSRR
ncbi:MAG: hypothetical protein ABI988_05930 [Nitrospirota bacterium]